MGKRIMLLALTAALLPVLCIQAQAQETVGTIRVLVDGGFTDVLERKVTLSRVGEQIEEGFRILDAYGGGIVLEEDALSPHLAQLLAEMEDGSGAFRTLDGDGRAEFSYLEPGLYLLAEKTEDSVILPTMVALPGGEEWEVNAYPAVRQLTAENPSTGQHPGPYIGAVGMVFSGIGLALCAGRKRK